MQHECTCGGGRDPLGGGSWTREGRPEKREGIYLFIQRTLIEGPLCVTCSPGHREHSNERDGRGPVLAAEPRAVTWSPGVHRIMKLLCPCAIQPLPRSARGLAPASALAPGPLPPICLANALLFFGVQLYSRSPRKPSLPSLLSQLPPLLASPYLSICLFCLSLKT